MATRASESDPPLRRRTLPDRSRASNGNHRAEHSEDPTRFRRLSRDVVGSTPAAMRGGLIIPTRDRFEVPPVTISCDRTLKIFCVRHRDRFSDRSCSQGSRREHLERAQDCSSGTDRCPPPSLSLSARGSTCSRPATARSKEMKQCLKQSHTDTSSLTALPLGQSRQRLLKWSGHRWRHRSIKHAADFICPTRIEAFLVSF